MSDPWDIILRYQTFYNPNSPATDVQRDAATFLEDNKGNAKVFEQWERPFGMISRNKPAELVVAKAYKYANLENLLRIIQDVRHTRSGTDEKRAKTRELDQTTLMFYRRHTKDVNMTEEGLLEWLKAWDASRKAAKKAAEEAAKEADAEGVDGI